MPPDATLESLSRLLLLEEEEEALPTVRERPGLAGIGTAAAGPRGEDEAEEGEVGRFLKAEEDLGLPCLSAPLELALMPWDVEERLEVLRGLPIDLAVKQA